MSPTSAKLTFRQKQILHYIEQSMTERGYPPSVREIGEAVGLASRRPCTHTCRRCSAWASSATPPSRAIEVRWDPNSNAMVERRPVRHVPLVGDVAAGTDVLASENVEELLPLLADFTGDGELFMLRVRGDSMIEAGILDGDFVVARATHKADDGDVVVAGIPGEEATIKTYRHDGDTITLLPSNARLEPMTFPADEVAVFGKVVTVMRRL
ncbi:MAG: transcriptional repressor LexA [Acidimicrobiales bacterium]